MDDITPIRTPSTLTCDRCSLLKIQCQRDIGGRICNACAKSKKGCYIGTISVKTLDLDGVPKPISARKKKANSQVSSSSPLALPPQSISRQKSSSQLRSSSPANYEAVEARQSFEPLLLDQDFSINNNFHSENTFGAPVATMSGSSGQGYTYKLSETEKGFGGSIPKLLSSGIPVRPRTISESRAYLSGPAAPSSMMTSDPDADSAREFSFTKSSQFTGTDLSATTTSRESSKVNKGKGLQAAVEDDASDLTVSSPSSTPTAHSTPPTSSAAAPPHSSPLHRNPIVLDPSILHTLPTTAPPLERIMCCKKAKATPSRTRQTHLPEIRNILAFIFHAGGRFPVRRVNGSIEPIPWNEQEYIMGVVDSTNDKQGRERTNRWFGLRTKEDGSGVNVLEIVKGETPKCVGHQEGVNTVEEVLIRREGVDVECYRHGGVKEFTIFLADYLPANPVIGEK